MSQNDTNEKHPEGKGDKSISTLEVYEKIVDLKNTEIFQLKEVVTGLKQKFYLLTVVGTLVAVLLSVFGIKEFNSVKTDMQERVKKSVTASNEYYDSLMTGLAYASVSDWRGAIPPLETAVEKKPGEEVAFFNLMACYVNIADVEAGTKLYEQAEKNDLFKLKFRSFWTYLQVGRLFMLKGLEDKKYNSTSIHFLDKAENIASKYESADIVFPKYAKLMIEIINGKTEQASLLGSELTEISPKTKQWPEADFNEKWFQIFLKKDKKFNDKLSKALSN